MSATVSSPTDVAAGGDNSVGDKPAEVNRYILALDVGTTALKCDVYDDKAQVISSASEPLELLYPNPGWVELEPDHLWTGTISVVKKAIHNAGISSRDVTCLGITTFRASFITWDSETGEPFHHFDMWQDTRTAAEVKSWNESTTLKLLKKGSGVLHALTGQPRFKAGYALKFLCQSIPLRLKWHIDNTPKLRLAIQEKRARFGTVDTWLLWKLTGGKVWATDHSSASCTLLYDTFQAIWSTLILGLVGLPADILPPIIESSGDLGACDEVLFGASIPITALIADQQSAMFGHQCFKEGDVKITMGTGSFVNVNLGDRPLASITGIYPIVGWKIGGQVTYLAEASCKTTGTCMEWLQSVGLIDDIKESSSIAQSVKNSDGVYFVPGFSGLPAPINDDKACGLLIGIHRSTTKAHITRAVIESFAFLLKLQYETMVKECGRKLRSIRVDGGVSQNDFLCQLMADLLHKHIKRPSCVDMTSKGAAYLAGLGAGIWKSLEDLEKFQTPDQVFNPEDTWSEYRQTVTDWERAIRRAARWYSDRSH